MWRYLVIVQVIAFYTCAVSGLGSLSQQLTDTTQLCCNQGTTYARNHTSDDCSSSIPPDVPSAFGTLCIFAMDQCCKEYFQKKRDCEKGVDIAKSHNYSCSSASDSSKNCCEQCAAGASVGSAHACYVAVDGKSAEQLLATDAFSECCKEEAEKKKDKRPTQPPVSVFKKDEEVYSVCEEYAPNELCAHHCIPIPGSYKCECNPGFMLMSDGRNCKEVTKNRCKPHNPCQHKCNDNGVQVKCSCRRGYRLLDDGKSCEDIDECLLDPPVCLPNTQCHNILGSYKCIPTKHPKSHDVGKCPPGFSRNFANNACDDINECALPNPPCPLYLCENTIGGYKCGGVSGDPSNLSNKRPPEDRCPPGFIMDSNEECNDVDECDANKDDCNKMSQFCINTRGSFYCQDKVSKHCPPGFKTNPRTNKCEDIDECEDGQDICRPDQICVNVPGEYDCKPRHSITSAVCPDGMRIDPHRRTCEDIDECVEGTHLCDQYQSCLNTNGSHECRCKLGFELDHTTGACVDINECATDQNDCIPLSQRCDNTVGSYLCIRFISCGTGYILHHSSSTCEDIDECAIGTHNCDRAGPEYHCVNIPGSFRCQRKPKATTQATPTPTPNPDYEYIYYDSEEEIEEEKNTTTSTTTTQPETTKITTRVTEEQPDLKENTIETDNKSTEKTKTEPTNRDLYNIDNENKIEPKPEIENLPEPTEPPNTSPKIVDVEIGEETAIVKGEKKGDGSVEINTGDIPKNEWTKIHEKPSNCQPGFESDGAGTCYDIDECAINRHTCSGLTETCRNTMGGYLCECAHGFRRDLITGACVHIETPTSTNKPLIVPPIPLDVPTTPLPVPSTPATTPKVTTSSETPSLLTTPSTTPKTSTISSTYTYPTTLSTELTTVSIPETSPSTEPSTTSTTTTSSIPSSSSTRKYFWGYPDYQRFNRRPFKAMTTCDSGYHYNSQTGQCEDVNECTNGKANCASVEICVNTEGGYRCECPPNWRLDPDRHRCLPLRSSERFPAGYGNRPRPVYIDPQEIIPETSGSAEVAEPEVTELERGGSVYKCPWGIRLADDNTCKDIDECATGEAKCGPLQICTNLPKGFICSCPKGHKLVGDHECEDIDECDLSGSVPICSQNADCINTVGSYKCQCHEGFQTAPINQQVCVDVDECVESPSGSLCEQRCNNVWGGYRCSCHRGYRLNSDNRTCSDVDECTEFKSKNLCVGRCANEPGSYRCFCPSGYRLSEDKRSCIDIDECETGAAPCANGGKYEGATDVCLNTRGGYRCHRITCPTGYRLESKHRCTKIQTYCPPSDWECAHQPSTYSYNFITFASKLYIPEAKVDLFTMRGPNWPYAKMRFKLRLVDVNAPPSVSEKADINSFLLTQTSNQAVISLVRSLEGPQSIELELSMELYSRGQFGGIAVAKIYIYVSEYEF
ncbi:unnamed protein product [Leptosia nina]|uniref:EGF-like domain-containing protein n=1 Tax=Leptosia nina TaxID=320188 RepID=A0AAV1JDT0_9NEOP